MALPTNKELTAVEVCEKHSFELSDGRRQLTFTSALNAMEEYASKWKAKYDELKAENERLQRIVNQDLDLLRINAGVIQDKENDLFGLKSDHVALQQQHQQLEDQAQRLADALDEAKRFIEFIDQHIEIPANLFEGYSNDLMNVMHLIDESGLSEYNQFKEGKEVTDKQRLARTVVAIAEDVSKDAESAEAYLKSEGVDVEKVKADAAYFAWKAKLIAVTESKTGSPFNGTINDEEARKWYESGATPYQCFRETWQSDGN